MTNNWDANFWRARRVMVLVLCVLSVALFPKVIQAGCVNIIAIENVNSHRLINEQTVPLLLVNCFDPTLISKSDNIALIRQWGLYVQHRWGDSEAISFWRMVAERISFLTVYLGLAEIRSGALDSAVVTLSRVSNAHQLLDNLGKQQLERKDYNDALAIYLVATRMAPNSAASWKGLGRAYRGREDMRNAMLAYQKAAILASDDPDSFYELGEVLYWLGDYQASINAYKDAIRLEPRRSHYHFGLGLAYLQMSNFQAAADALGNAVSLTPGSSNKWFLYAYGSALENLGQFCDAARQYRRAVIVDPTYRLPADRVRALEAAGFLVGCE